MKTIGITGQAGFIGTHLFNTLGLYPDKFERINFNKSFFENESLLDAFVEKCDVIIHLAGMNRHKDPSVIYEVNIGLTKKLIASAKRVDSSAHFIFSSTTQEDRANSYASSKKEARNLLIEFSNTSKIEFTGLIIPNVFGPFGNPYYNSVVATFCYQLTHGETPKIETDAELKLIYVSELVNEIIEVIIEERKAHVLELKHSFHIRVSEVLELLNRFKEDYFQNCIIPNLNNRFELNLFNTFRSYIETKEFYPKKFSQNTDARGSFTEIIRVGDGVRSQISFSTTLPGKTRGNHFHTRKVERFAVIKGSALIQTRKIGTSDILEFHLSGENPAFVDMPIWYAHNIKNVGEEELVTIFWINEFFDANDPDTFFEEV